MSEDVALVIPGEEDKKKSIALDFQGIKCMIEYEAGDFKSTGGGTYYQRAPYGHIVNTLGGDGDELDVFIGPNKDSKKVFVCPLLTPLRAEPTEDKFLLGWDSEKDAKAFMEQQYYVEMVGIVVEMSIDDLRQLVEQQGVKSKKIEAAEEVGLMLEMEEGEMGPTVEVDSHA